MDSQAHDQQQKDFLASLFPDENTDHLQRGYDGGQHNHNMSMFPFGSPTLGTQQGMGLQQQTMPQSPNSQISMDMLGSLMQGIDTHGTISPQGPFSPQSMLEQQFKLTQLQQLQQLQNQIFQQQIALISSQTAGIIGGSPVIDGRRDHQGTSFDTGLPTPGSSGKLHAQPPTGEYISPVTLGQYMDPLDTYRNRGGGFPVDYAHNHSNHYKLPPGSTSAPAHLAFQTSPSHSLPSPADADVDISPLTSPWLGAYPKTMHQSSNKRNASSSGDEGSTQPSRKRQSPAIRPTNPSQAKKNYRTSKSATSTPLVRSSRSRKGSTAGEVVGEAIEEIPGDTPSPVDLSMPPPAPPSTQGSSSSNGSDQPPSPDFNPHLTPVTPASIMNLGRLGIDNRLTSARQMLPPETRPKAASKVKITIESPARSKPARKNATGSLASPGLKAILPAGSAPPLNLGLPSALPGPPVQVRKTSHKAAEQKRRDSLKSTFDDLRGLLPPIPLPSDEKPDEPVLPGALPPRGPPKAGGEGPNKGVSKLQLLICGNEYIRQLKGRVQRRDEEIDKLRREVKRLRSGGGIAGIMEEMEELDLDRDLDAAEVPSTGFGRGGGDAMMDEDDGEDDPGEE